MTFSFRALRTLGPASVRGLCALSLMFGWASPASALDDPPSTPPEEEESSSIEVHEEIEVRGRGTNLVGLVGSATEGATSWAQLEKRPILRPGELVETTPGVVATQHSGGGKANQFFLRGFNLDHGTDFSVQVAGVPVNFPSHGHGQGYIDLNFMIPELTSAVEYRKGPYFAETGDFSLAGSLELTLLDRMSESLVKVAGGSDEYGRLLWADGGGAEDPADGRWLTAVELFQENGPWTREEDYDGFKALARYGKGDSARGFDLTFMAYDADWLSTDQIPRRAVESGEIGRFDLIDPGPRGSTGRYSLSAELRRSTADTLTRWRAYLLSYDFELISNFTYFLEDPERGDQFQQLDDRWVAGGELRHHWHSHWGSRELENVAGFQLRHDQIENGLFRTRNLQRFDTVRQDDIQQSRLGAFIQSQVRWNDVLRTRVGARIDYLTAEVDSDLSINSGSDDDVLASPKLSIILGPWSDTEVYINIGRGYHSNDARGATLRRDPVSGDPAETVDLLVPGWGADIGFRWLPREGSQMTFTVFQLELDSELVFVGDGGATEAGRPSRRRGVEWTQFWQLSDHWTFDLDITLTDSEFTDADLAGDEIPGAIKETVASGIAYDGQHWFGSLRWRYFGDVPLIEDGSTTWDSSSVVNGRIGYRFDNGLDLTLEIFNLFDSEDSDIEYFYASRLPGEPLDGIEDVHFHPLPERSARMVVTWRY